MSMKKDLVPKTFEPFTADEEAGLVKTLDTLSATSLESYISSATSSLGNNALAPSWRPRIEFAMRHAEQALGKARITAAQQIAAENAATPEVRKVKKSAPVVEEAAEGADDE